MGLSIKEIDSLGFTINSQQTEVELFSFILIFILNTSLLSWITLKLLQLDSGDTAAAVTNKVLHETHLAAATANEALKNKTKRPAEDTLLFRLSLLNHFKNTSKISSTTKLDSAGDGPILTIVNNWW